ncbi:MAG: B12-binding domain-containing radical SAM protein [Candidatus Omnitrophica bacterium]|nr:B12-binding domain-containing radical SAM protein [Candidatus Omnitrophota bacterium]
MKILLVGIYDTVTVSLAPYVLRSYAEQFPVASQFEIITKEFSIFNQSVEEMTVEIQKEKPDVVGFSVYVWNANEVFEIIPSLGAFVIIGGPHVTSIEKKLLEENPGIDAVVTGEGEIVFKELLDFFAKEKKLEDIPGITTREFHTPPRKDCVELDSIPAFYERLFREHPGVEWIGFETSRGCLMNCKYCVWSTSRKMRTYSLERVKRDLDIILNQASLKHIYFCDSNILLGRKRAKEIFSYLISRNTPKSICYEFHPDQLDDEMIERLSQLPHQEFNFGIQSVNPQVLKRMSRHFDRDVFLRTLEKVARFFSESQITVDLIYGLPGDNLEGYKASLDYAMSLEGVGRILTNPLIVLPGSGYWYEKDKYGIKLQDETSYLLKENATFTEKEMSLAREYSFYVSVLYLNRQLKKAFQAYVRSGQKGYLETLVEMMKVFFDPFVQEEFPDMIPSIREGYEKRNRVFQSVIERYDEWVEHFKQSTEHAFDRELEGYRDSFSPHYYKLKAFAGL